MAMDPRQQMNQRGLLEMMLREAGLGAGPLPPPTAMQGRNPMQAPDPRQVYQSRKPPAPPRMTGQMPLTATSSAPTRQVPRLPVQPQGTPPLPANRSGTFQERMAQRIANENPGIFEAALKEVLTQNIRPYSKVVENSASKLMPAIKALREHNIEQRRLMQKAKPKHGSVQA